MYLGVWVLRLGFRVKGLCMVQGIWTLGLSGLIVLGVEVSRFLVMSRVCRDCRA